MAYFNVRSKCLLLIILIFSALPLFSNKLFYLSTDRTYAVEENKRIKVESGSLNEVKIRVYKINDTREYFLSQDDFHRPKVVGRKFRYVTPEVVKGFKNYLKTELRSWARDNMPGKNRRTILNKYGDLSTTSEERYYSPSKQVDYLSDPNFTLVEEKKYVFERRSNNWNTNYVYFNSLKPGTYLIEGITGGKLAYTVLNVSPFSFITKKAGEEVQLFSVDNKTGEPVENIEYTIYDRFRNKITSKKSDSDGLAKVTIKHNDIFIVANDQNNNFSFYDPRYYPSAVSDRTVYLYTDRPVYKGGDEVLFKGIIRDIKRGKYYKTSANDITLSVWNGNQNISGDIKINKNSSGSFDGGYTLPTGASSGLYKVRAEIDDKYYEAEFKVEYYIKPEFRLSVKSDKKTYLTGENVRFNIQGEFYHGDPVKNAKVKYVISRTRYSHKDVSDQELDFYLSAQEWVYTGVERLSSGEIDLDNLGKGTIDFIVDKGDIKGNTPYTYMITATVENRGGADVTSGGQTRVVPVNLRLGLKTHKFVYQKNENVTLEIEAADYDKNPVSTELEISVYSKSGGKKDSLLKKKITTDENGKADFEFSVEEAGFISIEVDGKDLNSNPVTNEKSIWIGEEGAAYSVSGGFVKLVLDKTYYGTSDNARLLVVSPISDIPMLLTIEGTEIYSSKVIRLKENSALINIPIKKEYLPNVFITVDFIYENRHYNNSIKLDIPPVEKFLNIDIIPEEKSFSPESTGKVKIRITDNSGKPVENSELSISVVDEAVYGISEDLTVDIRNYFYHFKRNNVMTWTSSGFRFYGYAYNVKRELAAQFYKDATGIASFKGEDEESEEERKDFKDAIFWLPHLVTDSEGIAEIEIDFPSNITSWRITAIAIDDANRVGLKRENVVTKKDIFTKISLPETIGEYDESTFFINIYNNSFMEKKLLIKRSLTNLAGETDDIEITVPPYETVLVSQKVTAEEGGAAFIDITVTEDDIVHDKIVKEVNVGYHALEKRVSVIKSLTTGDNSITLNIPEDINNNSSELSVTFTNSYAGHISDSLEYLAQYPHGCVEQTTNRFLPNIAVVSAFNKAGIPLNGMDETLNKNIDAGINTLSGYQNSNGSWGWWQNGDENIFMSAYVLYGLSLANNLNYKINSSVLDDGINFLEENLNQGSKTEKIFAIYVLSLNDIRLESVYNSFDVNSLSDYELALLLLTAKSYRDSSKAKEITAILENRGKVSSKGTSFGSAGSVEWMNDDIETTAWVLRALAPYSSKELLYSITDFLISEKDGDRWKSTRDTAAAVMSISEVIPRIDSQSANYSLILNGEKVKNFTLSRDNYKNNFILDSTKLESTNTIKVTGLEKEAITGMLSFTYHTNAKNIAKGESGASISRKYFKLIDNGDSFSIGNEVSEVSKGDNFVVELEYNQTKQGEYIMITDNYPGGARYNKDISVLDIEGLSGDLPEAVDNRYGKVHFFFTHSGNKKIYYVLKADYPGSYVVSPGIGELMYFPEFRGNSESDSITIKGDKL